MLTSENTKKLLLEMSGLNGVAGFENNAASYAAEFLKQYGEVEITPLNSVICTLSQAESGQPVVMLDAHIDEIGLIVSYINDEGFLKVSNCGGIDRRLLLASPVTVHAKDGDLSGVICSIPPHLQSGEGKNPQVEDIFIDIGFGKEQTEKLVRLGDRVTINSDSREMLNSLVSGKALDNRAGCVSLMLAADLLKNKKLNCGVQICLSSMEEVGGQGAKTAAFKISPTHAIAVDVSFAHTPDAPKHKCREMNKGPMIGIAPILNAEMSQRLISLAEQEKIPYQLEVMGGVTGTNADSIACTKNGVITGLISIPQRYMHTPIETVSVADVENTARLIAAYVQAL
ncbi:MAG TPA: peptidase M42 [Ruminococcaceae bacterium]|nr:peptidase M42 [Oscillospiraceae bacterium]